MRCLTLSVALSARCVTREPRVSRPRGGARELKMREHYSSMKLQSGCYVAPARSGERAHHARAPPPKRKSVKSNSHSETHLERDIEQSRAIQSLPAATAQLCSPNTASATSATLVLLSEPPSHFIVVVSCCPAEESTWLGEKIRRTRTPHSFPAVRSSAAAA